MFIVENSKPKCKIIKFKILIFNYFFNSFSNSKFTVHKISNNMRVGRKTSKPDCVARKQSFYELRRDDNSSCVDPKQLARFFKSPRLINISLSIDEKTISKQKMWGNNVYKPSDGVPDICQYFSETVLLRSLDLDVCFSHYIFYHFAHKMSSSRDSLMKKEFKS